MLVEQTSEFARRHSMTRGYFKLPDKRCKVRLGDITLDMHAANGVWTIADHDTLTVLLCRTHAIRHRVDERVDAATYVLHIKDDRVEVCKHRLGRLARFAVERIHGLTCPLIDCVRRLDHVVLQVAADTVL